jgi:hypothetical protein
MELNMKLRNLAQIDQFSSKINVFNATQQDWPK